jgi:hypothetical protein
LNRQEAGSSAKICTFLVVTNFEIKIGDDWKPVKGTTRSMNEGWLYWTDGHSSGLAKPGTWRPVESSTGEVNDGFEIRLFSPS